MIRLFLYFKLISFETFANNSNNFIKCLAANENSEYIYPGGKLTKTCYELFQYWEQNGYPEYVCGVWSTNGSTKKITIGILENYYAGGNKVEDILKVNVEDDSNLTIVYQKHSKNKLLDIMDDMNVYLETKSTEYGLVSAGIYDDKNIVELSIKTAKKNDPKTLQFVSELREKYGDALSVIYTDFEIKYSATLKGDLQNVSEMQTLSTMYGGENKFQLFLNFALILLLFLSCFAIIYSNRKIRALKTSAGEEIKIYSTASLKKDIKNTHVEPTKNLDKRIYNLIKTNK